MPNVSIFKNVNVPANPIHEDLESYLEKTKNGEWQDIVIPCRLLKDKNDRDEIKKIMPTTCLSGQFSYRADDKLQIHSGFISMDLDHVEDMDATRDKLQSDSYVYSVFMSTSGDGLRVMFRINPEKHRESFRGISEYLYEEYGLVSDPNGISPSKPYVVSFDPFLYLNNNARLFKKYPKEPVIKQMEFIHTPGDFEEIVKNIVSRRVDICDTYDDWVRLGFALAAQFGEDGRAYYHELSLFHPKYTAKRCDLQYKYSLRNRGTSKVSISTFYYLAKSHGISLYSEQTKAIIRTTKNGKRAKLTKEQIILNLEKFQGIANCKDVVDKVWNSSIENEEDEESMLHLLEMFITNNYSLRMNEVTGYLENNKIQMGPNELNTMFISAKKLIPTLDYQIMIRLLKSDYVASFNPFFEFFGSDGVPIILPPMPRANVGFKSPLIDKLAQTIVNDDPAYTEYFLRKWLVSIVSSAHKVHSPLLFCLLGRQDSGKTEWFRRLLPDELHPYYQESKLDKEKDDEILMCENLIIMDDELGGKSKQDAQKLKNITSKQYFSLRRPYGDHNEKILRLAVLCGTSNHKEVLSDPTGNRRIIPVMVKDVDKHLYNSINKKDLFMEAFNLFKGGFDWRVMGTDMDYLNKDQDEYTAPVKEAELIQKYYEPGDTPMSASEIIVEIENITKQRLNLRQLGLEMEKQGFVRKSFRINATTVTKKWGINKINRVNINLDQNGVPF